MPPTGSLVLYQSGRGPVGENTVQRAIHGTHGMEKMKRPTWASKERFKPGGLRPPAVSLAATVRETTRLGHLHTARGNGKMDGEKMGCVGTPGRWHLGDGSEFQQAIELAVCQAPLFMARGRPRLPPDSYQTSKSSERCCGSQLNWTSDP